MVIQRYMYLLIFMAALLSMGHQSSAESITATLEVQHFPLQEASDAVKSQLSRQGIVTQLPSRHMLLIQDDARHIARARALLKRLDIVTPQLKVQVGLVEHEIDEASQLETQGSMLPGGWVRIRVNQHTHDNDRQQFFHLRVTSGKDGRVEAGHVRAIRPSVLHFLRRYGIADTPDLALVPITVGFDVQARLLDKKNVRVRIQPWLEREIQKTDIQARVEILPNLGSTNNTLKPPGTQAPMRLNMQPERSSHMEHVAITEAATELTMKMGETVTLAAARKTAKALGDVLMAHYSMVVDRSFRLNLTVTQAEDK